MGRQISNMIKGQLNGMAQMCYRNISLTHLRIRQDIGLACHRRWSEGGRLLPTSCAGGGVGGRRGGIAGSGRGGS